MKFKGVCFDERRDLISYVESGILEEDHIGRTIYKRARYNYFIKNLTDKKSYNDIIDFVTSNSITGLTDFDIYEFVNKAINSAKKVGLKRVDHIYITKSELEFIKSLNDIKLEKIAFVLLALAKYHNEVSGEDNNMVYIKLSEVKNMARINMNRIDFEYFYANLYDVGVLQRNTSPVSTIQIVDFVSHNVDDEVAFELKEMDYLELAYVYLSWKNDGKGYARCQKCNRLMRQGKTKPRKYCEECAQEVLTEQKRLWAEKSRKNLTQQNDQEKPSGLSFGFEKAIMIQEQCGMISVFLCQILKETKEKRLWQIRL